MSTFILSNPKLRSERGYVMVLSIIMLLVISLLTVSMARSFFFEEGMAGNIREKNRSYAAAQAALTYAEGLLASQGMTGVASSCSGTLSAGTVCSGGASITSGSSTAPLNGYFPVASTVIPTAYMTTSQTISQDSFYQSPGAYIQFLGLVPGASPTYVYSVTAYGYGSTPNSATILESTYEVVPITRCVNSNAGC